MSVEYEQAVQVNSVNTSLVNVLQSHEKRIILARARERDRRTRSSAEDQACSTTEFRGCLQFMCVA